MNICLFQNDEITKPIPLKDERSEHLIKVLHKKEGDSFSAGIIEGMAGTATITKIIPKTEPDSGIYFSFKPESDGKLLNPLIMIIGFPRPIQLKRLLRDIAGLGVCQVHLTGTELGEKSYMQSSLVERGAANQMLLDGTIQAGSTHIPQLFLHQNLKQCLESLEQITLGANVAIPHNTAPAQVLPIAKIALDNIRPASSLTQFLQSTAVSPQAIAAIGSERGWTDSERAMLEQHGYIRCGMGSRVLRTETAATTAAAIILSQMGALDA